MVMVMVSDSVKKRPTVAMVCRPYKTSKRVNYLIYIYRDTLTLPIGRTLSSPGPLRGK